MYSIQQFADLNKPETIIITQHSRKRFQERGITIDDVCNTIRHGEIIEEYPEDYPFPSCLISGQSGERHIHIVASIEDGMIYLITAYIPDPERWEDDYKTRKER